VEELHALSRWELQKRSEGARIHQRYGHEPLDFLAEFEGFKSGFVMFGSARLALATLPGFGFGSIVI
jgi:hypothetical protein